jgi:cell division protein FtsL
MTRIHLLLLGLLVLSALLLVRTAYDARRLFAEIEKARGQERVLEAEYQRLDAERRAQATHLRVERVAREKLQMRTATPAVTHYVPGAAGGAASAPRPASPGVVR